MSTVHASKAPAPVSGESGISRVSTLELFLDLVFVFTVTQLAELVAHPHGWSDYARAGLVLMVTWWIYSGYVWLTSNVATEQVRQRLLMFTGMLGFLLMALAIPTVMEAGGVMFGAGYLLVTLVHTLLFTESSTSSARAIFSVAPFNLSSALLVLLAGVLPAPWNWALWLAGVAALTGSRFLRGGSGFTLSPPHFAERHGLVIIVALGESVVAIGGGARALPPGLHLAVPAGLALALAASLWWSYFSGAGQQGDDTRAEQALKAAPPELRPSLALYGFGYGHLVMIAGIVVLSAGIKLALSHPESELLPVGAWNLAGGLALYLLGDVIFRWVVGIGPLRLRLVASLLALPTALVGLRYGGGFQLGLCVLLMLALLITEARRRDSEEGQSLLGHS
jgi:low temperature requirement protein LtrA